MCLTNVMIFDVEIASITFKARIGFSYFITEQEHFS